MTQPRHGQAFWGFQTRLTTLNDNNVIIRNNNSIVISDYYTEQGNACVFASGDDGDPSGRITIQSPKISFDNGTTRVLASFLNYQGQVSYSSSQMYVNPSVYRIFQTGARPLNVVLFGNLYYQCQQTFLASHATLATLGNADPRPDLNGIAPGDVYDAQTLSAISLAFDDLQHLGTLDLALNFPHVLSPKRVPSGLVFVLTSVIP